MVNIMKYLTSLKNRIKIPIIPKSWLGIMLWVFLFGCILLDAPALMIYILLSLLFIDKLLTLSLLYAALATVKIMSSTMNAMVQTQMLMEETAYKNKKSETE